MSIDVDNKNPWNVLMQLAKRVNGTDEVTHSDLQKLLKEADKNNDGLIELLEFKEAFLSSDEYKDLEEEYLAAFEEISKLDGDGSSISQSDINDAIAEYDKLANEVENSSADSYSYNNNYNSNSDNNTNNSNNNQTTQDLSKKELPELKSERAEVLNQISSLRTEKTEAIAQADSDVAEAQNNYNDATKAFSELVQEKIDSEETTNEFAQKVIDYEKQKNTLNSDITEQKSAVADAEDIVSTLNDSLSSLTEPPETVSYFDEETQQTVSEHNPEYDNYIAQKEALEAELAAAEEDLANKEDELEVLEDELSYTEECLDKAILSYAQAEQNDGTLSDAETEAFKLIAESSEAYIAAQKTRDEVSAEYDSKMDELQDNLVAYNDAITEKELELPDGYSVKDGKITNGKNNLAQTDEANLPEGYKIDGTSITDENGNVVGVAAGDEDSQQLYLYEEIESERVGAASCYENARMLFEEAVGTAEGEAVDIWETTDMTDVNPKDIKLIEKYYNMLVEEYNSNLQDGETPALTYTEEAERRSTNDEVSKANYEAIIASIEKVDSEVTIRPDSFEAYLDGRNIDISSASDEQMSQFLNEFMEQKYGKLYNEDYYPPVTEEQLVKYIGEEGLEGLNDADEATFNTVINNILTDDTLTPYQQMQLLSSVKSYSESASSYVNNYFENDDSYFYQKLNEMTSATNDDGTFKYSAKDMIEFIKQYKNIDDTSSIFTSADDPNNDSYMQIILSVYDRSEDSEELSELDTYISSSVVADYVLERYDGDDAQEYISKLFRISITDNLDENGNLSVNPEDYGLEDEETIESLDAAYLNSDGTTSEKIEKVIEDLNAGTIDKSAAQYLVSSILEGQPENIVNVQSDSQTISDIFELFGKKPYQAFSSDYKMVTQFVAGSGDTPPYLIIGPENVDPDEELPVIVYMHGSGEVNAGQEGLERYNQPGGIIPEWDLEGFNGYIICPTLSGNYATNANSNWTNGTAESYLRNVLNDFETTHNVDTDRIFVGGHSLGGNGALYMAEHMDDVFSKAFVLSGYEHDNLYNIENIKIPIIGFNGSSDSEYMTGEFKDTVGDENVVVVNSEHGAVPVEAFNRDADNDGKSDLLEWLLEDQALPQ